VSTGEEAARGSCTMRFRRESYKGGSNAAGISIDGRIVSGNQGPSCDRAGASDVPCGFSTEPTLNALCCSAERATQGTLINATSAHFAAISLGSRLHYNVTGLIPAPIQAIHEVSSRERVYDKGSFFSRGECTFAPMRRAP